MKKLVCMLLILYLIISGCNPNYSMYPLTSEKCAEINEKVWERDANLAIKGNREKMEVENVQVNLDSSRWTVPDSRLRFSVPTEKIKTVTIRDHQEGFLYGLIGTGAGILAMVAVKGEEGSTGSTKAGDLEITSAGWIRFFAVTVAIAAPVIGAIQGIKHNYILQDPVTAADENETRHISNTVHVTISSIIEKTSEYIIISWQGKEIRLLRSEYQYTATVEGGKKIIVVLKKVYETNFLNN